MSKAEPSILAQRKVYIQWRKGRKLHFIVGGYAYLLPWTSVVIRCPTRRFRKGHIRWLKDGRPLAALPAPLPRLTVSPLGYIRIQQLQASDAGVYTCVAGETQENFVLKMIGSKRKLAVPLGDFWLPDEAGDKKNVQQGAPTAAEEKARARRLSLGRYDGVVQRLLDMKDLSPGSKELLESAEKSGGLATATEDGGGGGGGTAMILVAETRTLDEVLRNLSGGHGSKDTVLAQLLGELTHSHGENNESTLHLQEEPESSTLPPQHVRRTNTRTAPLSIQPLTGPLRKPTIHVPQRPIGASVSPLEPVAYVGGSVLVPRQAIRLRLKCQAQGNPEPILTWAKDGEELQSSSR